MVTCSAAPPTPPQMVWAAAPPFRDVGCGGVDWESFGGAGNARRLTIYVCVYIYVYVRNIGYVDYLLHDITCMQLYASICGLYTVLETS